jgi:transcriptional regulator with XRE-family HTH domain
MVLNGRKSGMESVELKDLVGGQPKDVGRALSDYRQRNNLTLQDIANMTGVSVGTLSKLENDKATPSFRTLTRIMDVLNLKDDSKEPEPVPPQARGSARKTVTRLNDTLVNVTDRAIMNIHAAELLNKEMFPMVVQITIHTVPPMEIWTRHSGDEFVYVLSGAVEVHVEHYRPYVIHAGESTYYDSGMRHVIVSHSEEDAMVISVSTSHSDQDIIQPI